MRIAQIAPLWKKIPPDKYGGVEVVVSNLTEELVKMGHEVTLFACKGSKTTGELVEVVEWPLFDVVKGFNWDSIQAYEFLTFGKLFKRIHDFDIVHNHMGFHPHAFDPLLPIPMVTTLHSSIEPDFPYLAHEFKDGKYVSISNSQRSLAPYVNYVETIYHGINTASYKPSFEKGKYILFIGSLIKEKGADLAIRAVKELGLPMVVAGEIRNKEVFENEIKPMIDGEQIKFVGELNHEQKAKIYAEASVTLFPSQWSEAFGLVMVESLAAGTPVVGYNKGAVPEVIEEGKTGYIVDNFEDFKEKIKLAMNLDRVYCRKVAEEKFDVSTMGRAYEKLFQKLINEK